MDFLREASQEPFVRADIPQDPAGGDLRHHALNRLFSNGQLGALRQTAMQPPGTDLVEPVKMILELKPTGQGDLSSIISVSVHPCELAGWVAVPRYSPTTHDVFPSGDFSASMASVASTSRRPACSGFSGFSA